MSQNLKDVTKAVRILRKLFDKCPTANMWNMLEAAQCAYQQEFMYRRHREAGHGNLDLFAHEALKARVALRKVFEEYARAGTGTREVLDNVNMPAALFND